MANGLSGVNLKSLGILWDLGTFSGLDDRELIARFVERRGGSAELAFEVLVSRHGPMVLGVCQSLLGNRHAAEDAFQAVFLVLAKKARSIQRPEQLAPWLHGVALKTSRESRKRDGRRRRLEEQLAKMQPTPNLPPDRAILQVEEAETLHGEIARLPERYRVAIVLCDLEGLTHQEAASRLRCPTGTIAIRLKRGRERLRDRLTRRGLAPASGLMVLAPRPEMAPGLIELTVKTALATGFASASVVSLAQGVGLMMNMARWKAATTATILALGLSATWAASGGFAGLKSDEPIPERAVARAVTQNIRDYEDFIGQGDYSRKEGVHPKVGGIIQKIAVAVGARVKANDLLVEIDPKPFEEALKVAESAVLKAQAQKRLALAVVARNKALRGKNPQFVAQEEAIKAEQECALSDSILLAATQQVDQAKADLANHKVKAPFDGIVAEINAVAGKPINVEDAAAWVVVIEPIAVNFFVPKARVEQLRRLYGDDKKVIENLTIRVRPSFGAPADLNEYPHQATLESLPDQVDPATGLMQFTATVANPKGSFKKGMIVKVRIWTGQQHSAVVVPASAVATEGIQSKVYILNDRDVVAIRPVEVGLRHDNFLEIRDGLKPGDRVVVEDLEMLKPGMTIKLRFAPVPNR